MSRFINDEKITAPFIENFLRQNITGLPENIGIVKYITSDKDNYFFNEVHIFNSETNKWKLVNIQLSNDKETSCHIVAAYAKPCGGDHFFGQQSSCYTICAGYKFSDFEIKIQEMIDENTCSTQDINDLQKAYQIEMQKIFGEEYKKEFVKENTKHL